MCSSSIFNLGVFDIDPTRAFLPKRDPLRGLPAYFTPWEKIASDLPKLLTQGIVRQALDRLPLLDATQLPNIHAYNERAMLLLSYFGHAYLWGDEKPSDHIPAPIAVPWWMIGWQRLQRPPTLSYASYALNNWRRINPRGPLRLGNLALLQNFLGGMDEEWFILVHVEIEKKAAAMLSAFRASHRAIVERRSTRLTNTLCAVSAVICDMHRSLERMPERCDPYIYYHRVRPYLHGIKDNPATRHGVVYEGVAAYDGKPQAFRGETGAQSTIVPSLDAFLGIRFRDENDRGEKDILLPYLIEMRDYMPIGHRRFREAIEQGPSVRDFILTYGERNAEMVGVYNTCIENLASFRLLHLQYAGMYINAQSKGTHRNPTDVGTGGTPFMRYLRKHHDETLAHRIA